MKRWAVFEYVTYYPSGGMGDFVGAFESENLAEQFILRSFRDHLHIEDMKDYLEQESPKILTAQEFNEEFTRRREEEEKRRNNLSPMHLAIEDNLSRLAKKLALDLYG